MACYDVHQRVSRSTTIYQIDCGARRHHLVVRKGRIRLNNHPDLTTTLLATLIGRTSIPPCVKALLAIRHRTYDYTTDTFTLPSGVKITYRSIPPPLLYALRLLRNTRRADATPNYKTWRDDLRDHAVTRYFDPFCKPLRAARFYIVPSNASPLSLSCSGPLLFRRNGRWILRPSALYTSTAPCIHKSNAQFHCLLCDSSHPTSTDAIAGHKDREAHCESLAHREAVDRLLHTALTAWGKPVEWERDPTP
jgi:hypothetical protein